MKVWAYCGRDWVEATRYSAGVEGSEKLVTCPPADVNSIDLRRAAEADLVYLNLHGFLEQPYFYGQHNKRFGPTALSAEVVRRFDWSGVVVFAEVCFSAANGGSSIARAFLECGARAFVGSTSEAFGRVRPVTFFDGEADRLGHFFRFCLANGMDPESALKAAKRWLRLLSIPLDADDQATLDSFICLLPEVIAK